MAQLPLLLLLLVPTALSSWNGALPNTLLNISTGQSNDDSSRGYAENVNPNFDDFNSPSTCSPSTPTFLCGVRIWVLVRFKCSLWGPSSPPGKQQASGTWIVQLSLNDWLFGQEECDKPCPGAPDQKRGSALRMNVYYTPKPTWNGGSSSPVPF